MKMFPASGLGRLGRAVNRTVVLYLLVITFTLLSATGQRFGIAEEGPHHRVWRKTSESISGDKNVVELATGMNYWNGQKWIPSEAFFEPTDSGFVANKVQHKITIKPNLNVRGAVSIITPDGKQLRSTPIAIALYDTASGTSKVLASIRDCAGVLLSPNTILFEGAFNANGVCADVMYTVERGLFEQDVILTGKLSPVDYGFPPQTTRIQIYSEFYDVPQPDKIRKPLRIEQSEEVRRARVEPDFVDEVLGFGELVFGTGRASTAPHSSEAAAPVGKQFVTINDRTFLIEAVEYLSVAAQLSQLPVCQRDRSSIEFFKKASSGQSFAETLPAVAQTLTKAAGIPPTDMVAGQTKRSGLVLDYIATLGGTLSSAMIFQADTTYLITGPVTCNGAATIDGGTVIKYKGGVSSSYVKVAGALTMKTAQYRPAVFTGVDDDTVGESMNGISAAEYKGSIDPAGYASPALWTVQSGLTVSNVRFRYAKEALRVEGTPATSITLTHSQLFSCVQGIVLTGTGGTPTGPMVQVWNTLIVGVTTPLTVKASNMSGTFYNCTIDHAGTLVTSTVSSGSANFYNSVLSVVTSLNSAGATINGDYNGFYNCTTFGGAVNRWLVSVPPFQAVGAGYFYLTAASGFRDRGTVSGTPTALGTDLNIRTTVAPTVVIPGIVADATFSTAVGRDTVPRDLGYHYDPVDYVANAVDVSYATLTVGAGMVINLLGDSGFWLKDGARLKAEGSPSSRIQFLRYTMVQEQPGPFGNANNNIAFNTYNTGVAPPVVDCRFCDFQTLSGGGYSFYLAGSDWTAGSASLRDCQFYNGQISLGGPLNTEIKINNCLFERVTVSMLYYSLFECYNCLFKGGSVYAQRYLGAGAWTMKDNAFDNCKLEDWSAPSNAITHGYNAYINTPRRLQPAASSDIVLTSLTYSSGALGGYYQPGNSALRNRGSRSADWAGLFSYATTTDQAREGATQVDIGYHYVSMICTAADTVWVDDAVPAGATQTGDGQQNWVWTTTPAPFSTASSSQSSGTTGLHQYSFTGATAGLVVNTGDSLIAYVYPETGTSEIMIQWNDGNIEHRAYWGTDTTGFGIDGTASRRNMGSVPTVGVWTRLSVPASQVGLEGHTVTGIALIQVNGPVHWDYIGKSGGSYCYDSNSNGTPDYKEINPVITLSASLTYTEDAAATLIDSTGTVTDADSPDMAGGYLQVQIVAPLQASDFLEIRNQGMTAGLIGTTTAPNNVYYSGGQIGTWSGGAGAPMRITFINSSAVTVTAVQALLRNLTFRNTSQNFSPTTSRPLQVTIADGDGGVGTAIKGLTVARVNDAPTLTSIATFSGARKNVPFSISYAALAAAADEADVDSPTIQFRIEAVTTGTLKKGTVTVTPGSTLLGPADTVSLVWTPTTFGTPVNAFTVKAFDGLLPSAAAIQVKVNVLDKSLPPVLTLPGAEPNYNRGGNPALVDNTAVVTDPDSTGFNNAALSVAVQNYATADDRIAIRNEGSGAGQINVNLQNVNFGTVNIATFSGGVGADPLIVHFNAAATLAAVQAVVRNITYANASFWAEAVDRPLRFQLADGAGGLSAAVTKIVHYICPALDVVLVIDRSGSMDPRTGGLMGAQAAAKQFVSYLDFTKDQCALVSFDSTATLNVPLCNTSATLYSAIDGLAAAGGTRIDAGIDKAKIELSSATGRHHPNSSKLIVLLTDGNNSPTEQQYIQPSADAAKADLCRIVTIGLGSRVDKAILTTVASSANDCFLPVHPTELNAVYERLGINLCRVFYSVPIIYAGPDKLIKKNADEVGTITLQGSATGGATGNAPFDLAWSLVSGPVNSSVQFKNGGAAVTDVSVSAPGFYVLRLTGSNFKYSGSDEMVLAVYDISTDNQVPMIQITPINSIQTQGTATLVGMAMDDGLPSGALMINWSFQGGPVTVPPQNPGSLTTQVGGDPAHRFTLPGHYVYRLTVSDGDLTVTEDVTVTVCNGNAGPVDVVLLLDDSGSMGNDDGVEPRRYLRSRAAAQTFADFVGPLDQMAVLTFDSTPQVYATLTGNSQLIKSALAHLPAPGGSTALDGGLYAARDELLSSRHVPTSSPVVVLLSDGAPDFPSAAIDAANDLKNAGIRIVTIGLGTDPETQNFLSSISTTEDDAYFGVTMAELMQVYATIAESFCLNSNHRPAVGIKGLADRFINLGDPLSLEAFATDDRPSSELTYTWSSLAYDIRPVDYYPVWTPISATATPANPHALITTFTFPMAAQYVLRLTATDASGSSSYAETRVLVNDVPTASMGSAVTVNWAGAPLDVPITATTSPDVVSPLDFYLVNLEPRYFEVGKAFVWQVISGPPGGLEMQGETQQSETVETANAHIIAPGRYVLRLTVDDAYASTFAEKVINVLALNTVEAGAEKTGAINTAIPLSDSAINPGTATVLWTKQEGAGTATFSSSTALHPTVSFNSAGTYILRLTATFGAITAYDEITLRIGAGGVQAGPDILIAEGETANLAGTAVGTNGTEVTTQWQVVSAPTTGVVTFADAASKATTATFTKPGTYQLRLKSTSMGADDLLVYVNQTPVVQAAWDTQKIVRINSSLELTGSFTDDVLPINAPYQATWSKVSGPGNVTFTPGNSLNTMARFDKEGAYVLKLSVSDTHLTGSATVTVPVVNPPVAQQDIFVFQLGQEPFVMDVLRNDKDPEGDPLTIAWTAGDLNGSLALLNGDTSLAFVPNVGCKETWFQYAAKDRHGGVSDPVTVTIRVLAPPVPPITHTHVFYLRKNCDPSQLDIPGFEGTLGSDQPGSDGPLEIIAYSRITLEDGVTAGSGTLSLTSERWVSDAHVFDPQHLWYTPAPNVIGTFRFTYTVRNKAGLTATGVAIIIVQDTNADAGPTAHAGDDQTINQNQILSLNGWYDYDTPVSSLLWSVVSAPSGASVTFPCPGGGGTCADYPNPDAQFSAPGDYELKFRVTDVLGFWNEDSIFVTVLSAALPPIAKIFNLENDPKRIKADPVIVDGIFDLRGLATDPDPTRASTVVYQLGLWKPATTDTGSDTLVDWVTPAAQGTETRSVDGKLTRNIDDGNTHLGPVDFTRFKNGVYILMLEVWSGGSSIPATAQVKFALNSELKLGRLTFTEQDMALSAGGFPVQIVRSYDSDLASGANARDSDFGFGWKYELKDMDLAFDAERATKSLLDDDQGLVSVDLRTGGGRNVTLTLPDGRRVTFRFGFRVGTFGYAYAQFSSPPGVTATLTPKGDNRLVYIISAFSGGRGQNYWQQTGDDTPMETYEFPGYILRMADGAEYHLDADEQIPGGVTLPSGEFVDPRKSYRLTQILRPNGDRMAFEANATGDDVLQSYDTANNKRQALTIKRDTAGHIIKVIDAQSSVALPTIEYTYSNNRLQTVKQLTDRVAQTYDITTYVYDSNPGTPNRIVAIEDPRAPGNASRYQAQYLYYPAPDNRLWKVVKPGNREIIYTHDVDAHQETVTDPLLNQTVITYDDAGRALTTDIKNSAGGVVSRTQRSFYEGAGWVQSESRMINWIANTYSSQNYAYNASGNPTWVQDGNGFVRTFGFNSIGQVTDATDPRGNTTYAEYDTKGNITLAVDSVGATTQNFYDASGLLFKSIAPAGAETTYTYYTGEFGGMVGDLKTVALKLPGADTPLSRTTYTYDANSNIATEQSETSISSASRSPVRTIKKTYTYDPKNRLLSTQIQADPPDATIDATTSVTYNKIGKVKTSTDSMGRVTNYRYNADGNLVETEYPNAASPFVAASATRTVFDANGRTLYTQQQVVRPTPADNTVGAGSHMIYDPLGQVTRSEALGNLTIRLISSSGNLNDLEAIFDTVVLTPTTTPSATAYQVVGATESQFDMAGRPWRTTVKRPNAAGDPTMETEAAAKWHYYDGGGRQIAIDVDIDDASGEFIGSKRIGQYEYDDNGNLTRETRISNSSANPQVEQITDYEYDAMNRRTLIRFPAVAGDPVVNGEIVRATRRSEYDIVGNHVAEIDELGRTTRYRYDAAGRLLEVKDPDLHLTEYKYDGAGDLLEQLDARNQSTTFLYDAANRRVQRKLPMGQYETSVYDKNGNRTSGTDFNGKATAYIYDVLNRLRVITPDASFTETPIQYDYYANGLRSQMIDASGTTTYQYDDKRRLKIKATPAGTITYSYNDTVQRRSQTVTTASATGPRTGLGQTTITYTWNSRGQLVKVSDGPMNASHDTTYGFDEIGNLQDVFYPTTSSVQTHYVYDERNRLKDMTVGSASVARFQYTVGMDSLRTHTTESGTAANSTGNRVVDYTYDHLRRLTLEIIAGDEVTAKNGQFAYKYDDCGNRTFYRADPFSISGTTSTFDNNDRLGSSTSYDNNGNTLLIGASTVQYDFLNRIKSKTGGETLLYDGDGNIVGRTLAGSTVYYLVDDRNPTGYPQVLEEVGSNKTDVLKRYVWGMQLIGQTDSALASGDQTSYSGFDGHGNIRFLLKSDGTVRADRYVYDTFGRMIRSTGTTPNNYLYCGERWDSDLSAYYLRSRFYDPSVGRFLTMDAFSGRSEDPLSLHKYIYCNDDPVNNFDPTGRSLIGQLATAGLIMNLTFLTVDAVHFITMRNGIERGKVGADVVVDVALLVIPFGGPGARVAMAGARAISVAEIILTATGKGITIARWAWAEIRTLLFFETLEGENGGGGGSSGSGGAGEAAGPEGEGGDSRHAAFREAKRDAGIPMGQQPYQVKHEMMTSRGAPIKDENKQIIRFREYYFMKPDGSKVALQEHTQGDIAIADHGPHFNARKVGADGNVIRNSLADGCKDHYPFTP